jgi:hypothetical protein
VKLPTIQIGATANIDVTLPHQQEVCEVVDVVESSPAIDPAQVADQEQLTGVDIINLPYPNTRDYPNALNCIPGVINDAFGQPHIAGSKTYQTLTLLDGFDVTQPATECRRSSFPQFKSGRTASLLRHVDVAGCCVDGSPRCTSCNYQEMAEMVK